MLTARSIAVPFARCRRRRRLPFRPCSKRIGAPPRRAATISPTMRRSPNGPGIKVSVFAGEAGNIKLTTRGGFRARRSARRRAASATCASAPASTCTPSGRAITSRSAASEFRTIAALTGHSDADVALHALVDAILGALADGDIGEHFPPNRSAMARRVVRSDFCVFAVERVRARGGRIAHLDLTIVCEAPRDRAASRRHARDASPRLPHSIERVAVKATTSEKLGFTGRGEGIVADGDRNRAPARGRRLMPDTRIARRSRTHCSSSARRRS